MTDNVRRAIFFAQEEASNWGHNYVSTEHLLLGLTRDEESTASRLFQHLGLDREELARSTRQAMEKGTGRSYYEVQLAADAKSAFERSREESAAMETSYIGTEHLLLGLLQVDGVAHRVLSSAEITPDRLRQGLREMQETSTLPAEPVSPASPCEAGIPALRSAWCLASHPSAKGAAAAIGGAALFLGGWLLGRRRKH